MQHAFDALAGEYMNLLGRAAITREADVRTATARIIKLIPLKRKRYIAI